MGSSKVFSTHGPPSGPYQLLRPSSDSTTIRSPSLSPIHSPHEVGDGGAFYMKAGTLAISNCTITGCDATDEGGAVYVAGGILTVENSILWTNTAPWHPRSTHFICNCNCMIRPSPDDTSWRKLLTRAPVLMPGVETHSRGQLGSAQSGKKPPSGHCDS